MLDQTIGWCGKLPTNPDFIQSHVFPEIEHTLLNWIATGQNHIGEQLLAQPYEYNMPHFYYFLNTSLTTHKIRGLLFKSFDQRGRPCPFIFFTFDQEISLKNLFINFFEKFKIFNFNLNMLNVKLSQQDVLEQLIKNKDHYGIAQPDYWVELYPQYKNIELKVEKTNHIVFRKLILR